ncbi:MAG: DUF87 domain-containing protein [Candidatus Micrarchaeota archaeon]|nr:DUF87 domain-containing protein [Candidatus Micrarchaeota archaeon]
MQTVMTGRGCIIGQSGSGKSFLAGVIAEGLCRAKMPFCVIDTDGEYSSLRSSFNVIVVGGDRQDVGFDVDYSRLFASSIENNVPVILDVSDLIDKDEVVQKALDSLYELESGMRKPYLVLVEEADKFAPQVVGKKENLIEEISVRGRKRGIGLLVATQRPANISKNVLSQCAYGFIGKLTIENDLNAIKILFENRERLVGITRLGVGEFLPFGIGRDDKFKVKARTVRYIGMTPKVEEHTEIDEAVGDIIRELKGKTQVSRARKQVVTQGAKTIESLKATFSQGDAEDYARKIAKRKFILVGNATETIDAVELRYLPVGLCELRIPTSAKHEFLEYTALLSDKYEFMRLDNGVRLPNRGEATGTPRDYKRYLETDPVELESVSAGKDQLSDAKLSEKKAAKSVSRVFPSAVMSSFRVVYLPVYRITLRRGNKVRVFTLDGLYGEELFLG